jgi:2,4-dienoyl-CoA reductase-like NADH-dependent reductase (Old Yellow Enzyme family)
MGRKAFVKNIIGKVTVKNRLVRSAAGSGVASKEGYVTDDVRKWYEKVADGGAGLIISEMMTAWDDGNFPENYLRIDDDVYIDGLTSVADIVHKRNSKIIAQIGNYGSLLHWEANKPPVGPSKIKDEISGITAKALSEKEIREIINYFIDAAIRAEKAGFDGVQIHAAHGFLLNKFINPYYNRRNDAYGKDTEGRSKIIVDIHNGISKACGDKFLVLLKINSSDFIDEDYGFKFDESRKVCNYLSSVGFDAIEISSGLAGGKITPARPINEVAYNLEHTKIISEDIQTPVILVGGIRSFDIAEEILSSTSIHSIAMTRALTYEPELIKRWEEEGKVKSKCIACNKCFTTEGQMCVFNIGK